MPIYFSALKPPLKPSMPSRNKRGYLRGGQFRRRETDSDWLAISRASFNFTSYLSALNSFKRERATSFTDSTANGRIL
jgi:hypothetical protein